MQAAKLTKKRSSILIQRQTCTRSGDDVITSLSHTISHSKISSQRACSLHRIGVKKTSMCESKKCVGSLENIILNCELNEKYRKSLLDTAYTELNTIYK